MNSVNFLKIAHPDLSGLQKLASGNFNDTRRQRTGWRVRIKTKKINPQRDKLHRCEGGAWLFGHERRVALTGPCENPAALQERGCDLARFKKKPTPTDRAVLAMTD